MNGFPPFFFNFVDTFDLFFPFSSFSLHHSSNNTKTKAPEDENNT